MALKLRVVSDQRHALGERSSIVFGVGGGSIGRSSDNDWVLADALRYVSGRHARIHFRQGAFYLEDTSTNGIYVNDGIQPLSKEQPYGLQNGDMLRIGEYQIIVTIDATSEVGVADTAANARAARASRAHANERAGDMIDVVRVSPSPAAADGAPRSGHTDIGASLNLHALLSDGSPSDSFRAVNAYGQAIAPPRRDPEADAAADAMARRIARLAKAAANRDKPGASVAALYDVQTGLQAFCRGAGIESEKLPPDAHTRMLHLAGQLFREVLVGLRDLERSQQQVRNRFRIELPKEQDTTRPSLDHGVEDLAQQLLASHDSRRIDAVQWLREAFEKAKLHESAAAAANRAAFAEFIGRLNPQELEARFERAVKRGKQPDNWGLYGEFYRNLTEMPADHLPHLFVETFARAYLELMQKPAS
jgi:type VI secretion system protein